jgi:hypothetical protein
MKPAFDAKQEAAALARIEASEDSAAMRSLIVNAERLGADRVRDAAFRKMVALDAKGEPGALTNDFWQAIHTLEGALSNERGKATRLSRTRQKLARAGTARTVADLALAKQPSEGFAMLVDRGYWDLTAEAVVLKHPDDFEPAVVDAARTRLEAAGCDLSQLDAPGD